MDERLSAKEIVTFIIGFTGVVLFFCESDETMYQLIAYGIGAIIIGLAYLVWSIWSMFEEVRK